MEMVWNFSGPFFGEELGDVGGGLMVCGLPRGVSTECRGISWKSHILVLEGEAVSRSTYQVFGFVVEATVINM